MAYRPGRQNLFPQKRAIPRKIKCYRGYLPSVAMGDHLRYESRSVEKKLFNYLDFLFVLGVVKSIHPQPFRIEYGEGLHYHPDVLVLFQSQRLKPWLIEGKGCDFNDKMLNREKQKFRAAVGFARKNGFIFHFVTPVQLSCINDDILPFLETHRWKHVPEANRHAILSTLKLHGQMSPHDIPGYCKTENRVDVTVEDVWRLAADGKIFCDLSKNQLDAVVAAPVPINIPSMGKKNLFRLPFVLIRAEGD